MGRRALSRIVSNAIICARPRDWSAHRALAGLGLLLALAGQSIGCTGNSSQPDGGTVCAQGSDTCSDQGAFACTNGDCVPTCAADGGGCAPGFYCEDPTAPLNVCSPIQTTDCQSNLDCPAPQSCASGICSSLELRANGSPDGCLLGATVDGCAPDAICYVIPSATGETLNYCVGLSHCSEDGGCPNDPSGIGAVCNQLPDGGLLFAGKERLCLYGYCVDDSQCPAGNACFHRTPSDDLGQCQEGMAGDPCYTQADCFNSPTGCDATLDGGVDGGQDDGGSLGVCY